MDSDLNHPLVELVGEVVPLELGCAEEGEPDVLTIVAHLVNQAPPSPWNPSTEERARGSRSPSASTGHGIGVPLLPMVRRIAIKSAKVSYARAKRLLEAGADPCRRPVRITAAEVA
jgi:hypothetical protein